MPDPSSRPRRAAWPALILAVLLLGAALRFYALGARSLSLGEAGTMKAIEAPAGQILLRGSPLDAQPPLYPLALRAWMHGSRSLVRARAFSATVSLATLLVFYGLARALLPRSGAFAATFLLAISPFHICFAQEAGPEALATFLVTLSWYCLVLLIVGEPPGRWLLRDGLALANTAAVLVSYYSLYSIAAQFLVLLVLWRSTRWATLLGWVTWHLVPAMLLALYSGVILERLQLLEERGLAVTLTKPTLDGLAATAAQFACAFPGSIITEGPAVLLRVAAMLASFVLLGSLVGLGTHRRPLAVGWVWLLGPLAVLALLPIRGYAYEPRHVAFASPALALLAGVGLAAGGATRRALAGCLAVALAGVSAFSLLDYHRLGAEKGNWGDLMADVVQRVEPNDIVVFHPAWVRPVFDYYYHDSRKERPIFTIEAPRSGNPFSKGELALGRRLWLIERRRDAAPPNPALAQALKPHRKLYEAERGGSLGRLRATLYDTFVPAPSKGEAGS